MSDAAGGADGWPEAALAVLRDARDWRLPAARWAGIPPILQSLADALDAGDWDGAAEAARQLDLVGTVRITRIGTPPSEPAPPPVRERINQLIHRLSGGQDAARDTGS
jgi:hypothetical protein